MVNEQSLDQLEDLGLQAESLAGVLRGCLAGYLSCTSLDAPTRAQTEVYFEAVRLLREWLLPLGWEFDNVDQQPRVFSRDRGIAIVFASGDSNTGKPFPHPRTRRAKGEATQTKIMVNQSQLSLAFEQDPSDLATEDGPAGLTTYILLVSVDEKGLRAELSIPEDMDASGFIDTWTTRILLAMVGRTPEPMLGHDEDEGPVFDVDVARR